MQTLGVALGERSYPIHIGTGLLDRTDLVLPCLAQKKVAVVTNTTVAPLFMERLAGALARGGVEVVRIVVADGEEHKDWRTLNTIFDALIELLSVPGAERRRPHPHPHLQAAEAPLVAPFLARMSS